MQLSLHQLEAIRAYFSTQPVLKAYVFGSFARNEAEVDSDVDILVELDPDQHIGLGFLDIKFDLEDILQRDVDLVSSRGLSKYIAPAIDRDKSLIYVRE